MIKTHQNQSRALKSPFMLIKIFVMLFCTSFKIYWIAPFSTFIHSCCTFLYLNSLYSSCFEKSNSCFFFLCGKPNLPVAGLNANVFCDYVEMFQMKSLHYKHDVSVILKQHLGRRDKLILLKNLCLKLNYIFCEERLLLFHC